MSALDDLIASVERAEGPDARLEVEIIRHFGGDPAADGSPVTASMDAVVSLIRREMPGADEGYDRIGGGFVATLTQPHEKDGQLVHHKATPALALLLAFLRAARARQENDTP